MSSVSLDHRERATARSAAATWNWPVLRTVRADSLRSASLENELVGGPMGVPIPVLRVSALQGRTGEANRGPRRRGEAVGDRNELGSLESELDAARAAPHGHGHEREVRTQPDAGSPTTRARHVPSAPSASAA
jgi:hypothetical protein